MRVLFTVSDYTAHYFPMVPLGWALQAAGHDVRVACAPSQQAAISRAGLVAVPILGGPDMMERGRIFYYFAAMTNKTRLPLHPVTGEQLGSLSEFDWPAYKRENKDRNIGAVAASMDAAVAFTLDWQPDLIVHDLLSLEGILAAQVATIPAVCHLWGAIGIDETEPGVNLLPPDHNKDFDRHGAAPMSADLVRYVIDPCPPSVAGPTRAQRFRVGYLPYNGVGAPPSQIPPKGERPRVCVVWGSSLSRLIGSRSFLVPTILEALSTEDIEVLLACDDQARQQLGPVPANVKVLGYTPLHLLLPSCDAVVYHGGAGCAMTAVAAGTPHVALPFTPEQAAHARRMAAAGVGLVHDGASVDAVTIRESVHRLLTDPAYAGSAAALRIEMADRPSPAQLVAELERLPT